MTVVDLYKRSIDELCKKRFSSCETREQLIFTSVSIGFWLINECKLDLVTKEEYKILETYLLELIGKEMDKRTWN